MFSSVGFPILAGNIIIAFGGRYYLRLQGEE